MLGSDVVPGLIYNQLGCGATVATVTLNVVRANTVTITWKHAGKTGLIGATLAGTDTWTVAVDAPTLAGPERSVGAVEMTITATNASGSEEIKAQQIITISSCKP